MLDWFFCFLGIIGSSVASMFISWIFSSRYNLVADIITVPSIESKFSKKDDIKTEKGFDAYDTYVVLYNHGNQSLQMSDFAPLNMPHILINGGRLQRRDNPYKVLPNPDPFAMYNNVKLFYDGESTINVEFDQLKAGQNIEIVVHSLIPENHRGLKLGVAATLKNGKFISKKQLRASYGMIQIVTTAVALIIFLAIPTISTAVKSVAPLVMAIWWPVSIKIVDVISYFSIRGKIIRK